MKLLLIDDHALFRSGLTSLLERWKIKVVAAAGGPEGIEFLKQHNFDIVLLDLNMPNMSGLEVLKWIRNSSINTPIIMLTTSDDAQDLADSLRLGAHGYLLKDIDPEELVNTLQKAIAGEMVIAPALTQEMTKVVQQGKAKVVSMKEVLTARELEVLRNIAKGWSNKVIARELGIADGTVKLHVKSIFKKINVHSRVEAAVLAVEENLD